MGATRGDILRLVAGQALRVVAIGAVLAALGTAVVTRVMWAELLVVGVLETSDSDFRLSTRDFRLSETPSP